MNIDRAFNVTALSINDAVGILGGDSDPAMLDDETIPIGSLYLRIDGTIWQKWRMPKLWITISRWAFLFTASRASALDYIPTSVERSILFYLMPVNGVVVGIYAQASKITKGPVTVELWVEGQPQPAATLPFLVSSIPVYGSRLDLSLAIVAGERLQVRMAEAIGTANDLMVTVVFAQRSHG